MGYWLTGLDEAGYGPLLGPLVVGLTTLTSENTIAPREPWKLLAPTVCKRRGARGVSVADSKSLHKSSTGDLSPLEEGVLSFLSAERGDYPKTFRELMHHLTEGRLDALDEYPWYRDRDLELPVSVHPLALKGACSRVTRTLGRRGLEVSEMRVIAMDVVEFNASVATSDSKGAVNEGAMGRFLKWVWSKSDRSDVGVFTDRLGGRERYGSFLQPLFPDAQFKIVEQGKDRQLYSVHSTAPDRNLTVSFEMGGEDGCFTTALASMTAKYVRELHMRLFNSWWQEQSDTELNPTAGYYQDGKRFLGDIAPLRKKLGIEDRLLIRRR